jgi:hypothetical protein
VHNVSGSHKTLLRADRLLTFHRMSAYNTTEDLALALGEALEKACGGDDELWQTVRSKVYAFTPDGAYDEQLAGRLTGAGQDPIFPNLHLVLRCSAHAIQGAIKAGWQADELSNRVTRTLVQEVAKYIRSSDRFAARVSAKALNETVAALSNFSFAPQRFSSRDRPLSRFVLFSKSVLEALCLEVVCPTSADRKKWAQQILRDLDTSAWLLIGMLADLADDCTRFVRKLDERRSDPVEFCEHLEAFRVYLKQEYIQGRMWLRSDTYTERMVGFLSATRVVQFGKECAVLGKPSSQESRLCQAHVANVADGILKYIKGEFPDFCAQAHFACFRLHQPQPHRLRELLVVLGWDGAKAARCVQQYNVVWPRAVAVKQQKQLPDSDCWVCAFAEVCPREHTEIRDILGILVSFLVSETECERNFSVERRQFEHRPRLSASLRSAGLKVMVDGAPLKDLQHDGAPRGYFFLRLCRSDTRNGAFMK